MYSKTVLDHFTHPRNVGAIEHPDGYARVKSAVHDDLIDISIRVQDGRIADIKFRALGCAAAIAVSSMTSEMAKGRTLEEAAAISDEHVVEALGGLPESKIQCSVLAPTALKQAIGDYRSKHPEMQLPS